MSFYRYKIQDVKIVDGDTVDLVLDLGFGTYVRDRFRLYGPEVDEKLGLNCPESNTTAGQEAKKFLISAIVRLLSSNIQLIAHTVKDRQEKFGRYLVVIKAENDPSINVNLMLVQAGHAVLKQY